MAEYVDDAFLSVDLPAVPAGFKLAPVGLPQRVELWNTGGSVVCEWALQITNMDEEKTIQLGQLQMRLHALPSQDRYTLVDICSLPLVVRQGSCLPGQTGGGNNYTYNFDLGTGKADRVIQGRLTGEGAYDPTLPPGKTVEVDTIFAAPPSAGIINYAVTPQITVNMSGEQRILPIDQLQTTISLVTVQQLSCYTLHGNTFEPLPPKPQKNVWCL
jgi:hypothetical protein